jgi:tetratricopeptide (TPR) repeat protein
MKSFERRLRETSRTVIAALCLWMSLSAAASSHAWDGPDDPAARAKALSAATDASLARGDYQQAIAEAREAFALHERLGQPADAAWDLNAIGLANQYLARFADALDSYRRALDLDRAARSGDGEVQRLTNIGGIHFLQGRYSDALTMYQEALAKANTVTTPTARGRLRKMTISNLAALNQRLGADERALDLYAQLVSGETMQPSEEAQLLVNQGALLRRLGDPDKALAWYRAAQRLFAGAAHRDGEIGAWRNIGIVYALDLNDNGRALEAFEAALKLARGSSNRRGEAQALLYRGEVLRRMNRLGDADRDLRDALDAAVATGLVEEQWKALYGRARVAQANGDRPAARNALERAIATIESVRSDLRTVALRSEFLADKRDVYDALIRLRLDEQPIATADLFQLLEQSRARTWQDRLRPDAGVPSFAAVQRSLPADALLLEYWIGSPGFACLWMSRDSAGVVSRDTRADHAGDDSRTMQELAESVATRDSEWRPASVAAGRILLDKLPALDGIHHLLVVTDGPLHFVPFETLTLPASTDLIVQRFDVSYVPSAAWLLRPRRDASRWAWPWRRELVAFGAPSPPDQYPLETRTLPPLPYADDEVRQVAGELGGRADLHIGDEAQKRFVTSGHLRTAPLVHFATHAVADTRDPDRSRILLAPPAPGAPPDYLFLREVADLDLTGVELVTLSACQTERGRIVRGEGVEGFSRALLASGAAASVTTLWDIADRASAALMTQFYFFLADGRPKAEALRQAKLQLLGSNGRWSHPYYWAGYVLTGDGSGRLPRVISTRTLVIAGVLTVVALAGISVALRSAARLRPSRGLRRTAG